MKTTTWLHDLVYWSLIPLRYALSSKKQQAVQVEHKAIGNRNTTNLCPVPHPKTSSGIRRSSFLEGISANMLRWYYWQWVQALVPVSLPRGERSQGGSKARHAPRPSFPKSLLYQLALGGRVYPPEGAFAWFFLGTWHFDEITVQREIVANWILWNIKKYVEFTLLRNEDVPKP